MFFDLRGAMNTYNPQTKENEELRLLYQITVDDIKYAKSLTTYSVLLTFAVIIGFYILPEPDVDSEIFVTWYQKLWLLIPAFGINAFGIYHVTDTQKRLCGYRMRLTAIKEEFEGKTKKVLDLPGEHEEEYLLMAVISGA